MKHKLSYSYSKSKIKGYCRCGWQSGRRNDHPRVVKDYVTHKTLARG